MLEDRLAVAEHQSRLRDVLPAGMALILSVVAWGPPAVERAGINACSRMRHEGQWVHQQGSSLNHAFTVQTLPTQALPENEDCLKNYQKFQVFWKCWAYLIVFLVSMPISHSQYNFSICSLQSKSQEMYFFFEKWKLRVSATWWQQELGTVRTRQSPR